MYRISLFHKKHPKSAVNPAAVFPGSLGDDGRSDLGRGTVSSLGSCTDSLHEGCAELLKSRFHKALVPGVPGTQRKHLRN